MTQVINIHHYGGVNALPENSVYIGRPGPHGNSYSSKTGKFSREECVAFHRIDLYLSLIENKDKFAILKTDLEGKNLACWCKHPKREIACHGDNYVHIFKDVNKNRDYSKSVLFYLLEDLKNVIGELRKWVMNEVDDKDFINAYISFHDAKLEIEYLFVGIAEKKPEPQVICEFVAKIVIELELALVQKEYTIRSHWLSHVVWTIQSILRPYDTHIEEPTLPNTPLKRKRKV